MITDVEAASASAGAGLHVGDVVTELDRRAVGNADEAVKMSEEIKGPKVLVRLWRNGRQSLHRGRRVGEMTRGKALLSLGLLLLTAGAGWAADPAGPLTPALPTAQPLGEVPPAVAKRKLTGQVFFSLPVAADGTAGRPRILAASHADFVLPALAALAEWKFDPARRGDQPVDSVFRGLLTFNQPAIPPGQLFAANLITGSDGQPPKTLPTVMALADPVWPYDLLLKGVGGEVVADFTVLETGKIGEIRVRSETRPEFGRALAAAIEAWELRPARRDGAPVPVALEKRVIFRLRGKAPGQPEDPILAQLVTDARQQKIESAKGLDAPLVPVYQVAPLYPAALRVGTPAKGSAEISIVVCRDGRVRLPRIMSSTRDPFGWAAATAVAQWVFLPPTRGGEPVDVSVLVPFVFDPPPR